MKKNYIVVNNINENEEKKSEEIVVTEDNVPSDDLGLNAPEEVAEDALEDSKDVLPEKEEISLRGKTARHIVKVANNFPVLGQLRRNGQFQNLISEHEREWKCPEHLINTVIDMEKFKMEYLENAINETDISERYVVLQLHGGGYYGKLHNTYRAVAAYYNEISGGFSVLSPDYRVAPEDPFPAALEDAVSAYEWLLDKGYSSDHIIVSGDSAGGGLSLALVMYLREHSIPLPCGVITMSAWTDLTKSGDSYEENYDSDPVFGGSMHTLVYKQGYYSDHDPMNPYISPVFGDFDSFPPLLMQVGELEMLLDDTISVFEKAKESGVKIKEHTYPGMFHVFQLGLNTFPESKAAWDEIAHFLHIVTADGFFS